MIENSYRLCGCSKTALCLRLIRLLHSNNPPLRLYLHPLGGRRVKTDFEMDRCSERWAGIRQYKYSHLGDVTGQAFFSMADSLKILPRKTDSGYQIVTMASSAVHYLQYYSSSSHCWAISSLKPFRWNAKSRHNLSTSELRDNLDVRIKMNKRQMFFRVRWHRDAEQSGIFCL